MKGVEWILRELGSTTLVAIHPDSGAIGAFWLDATCVDRATRWAAEQNRVGFNIYFTANLPRQGLQKKPTKADIEAIRCIFADLDAKDGRTMDDCLEALTQLSKQPSLVIMSGGGYQPIWLLDQPDTCDNRSCAAGREYCKGYGHAAWRRQHPERRPAPADAVHYELPEQEKAG